MNPAFVNAELAQVGAIVVDERVVRRVIDAHLELHRVGLQVPHARCYSVPRSVIERHVDPDEIGPGVPELPDHVAVITADRAALASLVPAAWSSVWRAVFHERIHQALDAKRARGELTLVTVRHRIHEIGQIEFDEIRSVLRQEELVLPPGDDVAIYCEFVALYLELRCAAPDLIEPTFSALRDLDRVDATLALDIPDPAQLFAACRPASAPERPLVATEPPAPGHAPAIRAARVKPAARKRAAAARGRGNRARAAILAVLSGDDDAARRDLDELVASLASALGVAPPARWSTALVPVVQAAAAQRRLRVGVCARLLHDLQSACLAAEREAKVVDVFTWLRTRGRRPIVRTLPATREVRVARHIRAAVAKLDRCDLSSAADRDELAAALHEMALAADASVRAAIRPKFELALRGVGLEPHGVAELVSEKRLGDELLDRAVAIGRLSLGDLRDAISRNDLKMHDLRLGELRKGDPLLRCDRILSVSLDGVYRRGEVYMRFLQKLSSLLFGTPIGRLLTLYLLLPALGALAVLEGLQHMVAPVSTRLFDLEPQLTTPTAFAIGAAGVFLLLHVPITRRVSRWMLRAIWRVVRLPLIDVPRALWRHAMVRRLVTNRIARWVVRPAIPAAVVAALVHGRGRWPIAIALYVALAVVTNLRSWRILEERLVDWLVRSSRQLAGTIVPGIVKSIAAAFAWLLDVFERGMYRVDLWLRFRSGQGAVVLVVKGVFGTIWSAVTYVLRLYINLFFEPTVNPIKHFPVVTVAAKILLPFTPVILEVLAKPSVRLMGPALGNSFAVLTDFFLPGLAGFLVWELKENWKLYRETRHKHMRPLVIGHHGESMVALLTPGLHSGTIPKHFARIRRAAWRHDAAELTKQHHALEHVVEAIATFVDRQLVSILNQAPGFMNRDPMSTRVVLASNRVEIELGCPRIGPQPLVIRIEQQDGWLLAGLWRHGWLDALDDGQRRVFEAALCGFYKLAGVGLVREQLEGALRADAPSPPDYHIAAHALRVWPPQGRFEVEITYDLRSARLKPKVRGATYDGPVPRIARDAVFERARLRWSAWVNAWQQISSGGAPPPLVRGPSLLGSVPEPAAATVAAS